MIKICVIIPVYNNHKTISDIIDNCYNELSDIIVIDDGSSDGTSELINNKKVIKHHFDKNSGKGAALKKGFSLASLNGYTHCITIDADGQHDTKKINDFIKAIQENPNSIIVGARNFPKNRPARSKAGNFFANIFFTLSTFLSIPDTQSGYRAYPLNILNNIKLVRNRYDFELEILIKARWQNISILSIPIPVSYQDDENYVSHFNVKLDGIRSTKMMTGLIFRGFLWEMPKLAIKKIIKKLS